MIMYQYGYSYEYSNSVGIFNTTSDHYLICNTYLT